MKANTTRSVLLALVVAASSAAAAVHAQAASEAFTREAQAALTPAQALTMLKEGNLRFSSGKSVPRFPGAGEADRQRPISFCRHSELPRLAHSAIVFDRGIGDLFVARVAGNFVNDDILGSLEFSTKLAGAKLIVVMGHSECGAIKGACDSAQLGLLSGQYQSGGNGGQGQLRAAQLGERRIRSGGCRYECPAHHAKASRPERCAARDDRQG
jgi:carbonic anhydrase